MLQYIIFLVALLLGEALGVFAMLFVLDRGEGKKKPKKKILVESSTRTRRTPPKKEPKKEVKKEPTKSNPSEENTPIQEETVSLSERLGNNSSWTDIVGTKDENGNDMKQSEKAYLYNKESVIYFV